MDNNNKIVYKRQSTRNIEFISFEGIFGIPNILVVSTQVRRSWLEGPRSHLGVNVKFLRIVLGS